jgi:hypothetical protein
MKRKPPAHSPTTKRSLAKRRPSSKQLEERFALLLLLLQHNFEKALRKKPR